MTPLSFLLRLAMSALCLLLAGVAAADPVPTKRVLVLYASGRLLPVIVALDRGIRQSIVDTPSRHVEIYDEFLDAARFHGAEHDDELAMHLQRKYAAVPPDVVVVADREALQFLVGKRHLLPKGTSVVHVAVSVEDLARTGPLPPGFVGVPTRDEFRRTIEQALQWQPQVRRVVAVLGGGAGRDEVWRARVLAEKGTFEPRVAVEMLQGLSLTEITSRLAALPSDTIVFSPGFEMGGDGHTTTPYAAITAILKASPVPVYGPFSTFMGTGIVGGYVTDFDVHGQLAGRIVSRLLDGERPDSLTLPAWSPTALQVDWRQLHKYGFDEAAVPADAVVRFRQPSLWEQYRREMALISAVVILQAALIAVLLMERRRRHAAEMTVATSRAELAHASRLAVAGELAAAVAHEINQPLGAILSNADTAEIILSSGVDRTDLLRRILSDIRRDDIRASEVIRRLRTLLQKNEVEQAPFGLDDAAAEVELVLRPEARRRRVNLSVMGVGHALPLIGDRVQIQQVLINLVLNAMDAVANLPEERRVVTLTLQTAVDGVAVHVRDRGPGIAPENLTRVFESFFTTKRTGMGLGLSIARTIVDAHGGTIRAENGTADGAVFIMELPAATASQQTVPEPWVPKPWRRPA